MADETKTETPAAFDPKAVEAMVQNAVKSSIEQVVKDTQAANTAREAQQAEDAATAARAAAAAKAGDDPFNVALRPALEPALKAARDAELRATLAADAVTFYTDPANAPTLKYRAKIEEVVTAQLKRGNVISRQDAWSWLRGGALYDELGQESLKSHEAKLEEARKASAAAASVSVGTVSFKKPIESMETKELGDALSGVTF